MFEEWYGRLLGITVPEFGTKVDATRSEFLWRALLQLTDDGSSPEDPMCIKSFNSTCV